MAFGSPTRVVPLDGERTVTLDDVGDPAGVPVVYLHGTPDSRRARHPDDGLAAAAGVRLLAVDRPGYGGTSQGPGGVWRSGWPADWAADVAAALDAIGVDRCAVLAWSGGALGALALATHGSSRPGDGPAAATSPGAGDPSRPDDEPLAGRVAALGIVAGLVPRQAYDDPAVRAAGEERLGVIELADVLGPGELGDEIAPMLAPYPCDEALAAEHQAEQRSSAAAAELASVPGGVEVMATGLVEAVRPGLTGVAADVEAQARPLDVDVSAIACPVRLWYGEVDGVAPVAFGRWYAAHLPTAHLTVVPGAGHYVALTHWATLLAELANLARP